MALAIATEKMKKTIVTEPHFWDRKSVVSLLLRKSGDKRSDCPTLGLVNNLVKTGERKRKRERGASRQETYFPINMCGGPHV